MKKLKLSQKAKNGFKAGALALTGIGVTALTSCSEKEPGTEELTVAEKLEQFATDFVDFFNKPMVQTCIIIAGLGVAVYFVVKAVTKKNRRKR